MAQLGRLHFTVQDSTGAPVSGASIEVRKQGATIQSGGATVFVVDDPGSITTSDNTAVGTGTTVRSVSAVTVSGVTVGAPGHTGTANNDRLTVTNNLPTLYLDAQGNQSTTNPVTTDATGQVSAWAEIVPYDVHISGTGVTTELRQDQVPQGFGQVTDNTFDAATSINYIRNNQRAASTVGNRHTSWRDNATEVMYLGKGTYGIGLGIGNNASPDNNGATDQKIYVDDIRTISGAAAAQVYIAAEFTQRAHGTATETGILLNTTKTILRLGNGTVGGGGYTTNPIACGNYLEYRGDDNLTGTCFGTESASTMYTGATVVGLTGLLGTAQTDTGTSTVTTARGVQGIARHANVGAGTITDGRGVEGSAGLSDTSSGDMTTASGGYFFVTKGGSTSGTIGSAYGIQIVAITQGTTNNFGLRIGAASGGANTNQALRVDGSETYIGGPLIGPVTAFADGDATPSVSGSRHFKTANTAQTQITTFNDGAVGQEITIIIKDTDTEFIDGATLNMSGAANLTTSVAGDMITFFTDDGTNWYEVTRSVNS